VTSTSRGGVGGTRSALVGEDPELYLVVKVPFSRVDCTY
jgi:hypothetical protein